MRRRFFRRLAAIATLMLVSSLVGVTTLVRHAVASLTTASPSLAAAAPLLLAAVIGVAVVAMAMLAASFRRMAMPLAATMEAADRVAAGDYSARVGEQGPLPIRALARSFNTMTERLESHDRVRRDLMADVAHELRTPLTVIQGKLEGLLDGVYPRDDEQLQQLLEETHLLSRLVEDLRTLALSESGALKLQRETSDVVSLADDVVSAFASDAAARGVALDVVATSTLPAIEIDPIRIREVLNNLVANALRHTPAGGSVTIHVTPALDGGVAVEVRDTGSGMSAGELAHAFDRFYKGSKSRGSGLGLTIAKNLVAAHGGEISASSEPGRGTTIAFTLPADPAASIRKEF